MRRNLLFLIFLLVCLPELTNAQFPFAQTSILFTGDIMLDRGVRKQIHALGVDTLFSHIDTLFYGADYTVANLECPAAEKRVRGTAGFIFNADPAWLPVLCGHRITHVSLANNHSSDQMQQGIDATVANVRMAGLGIIGAGIKGIDECAPSIIDKGTYRIALFGSVHIRVGPWNPTTGKLAPCQADARELSAHIGAYRREHPLDVVVAVLHWGVEYRPKPTASQKAEAHLLIDSGATAIIGHHPHVVESIEIYKGAPICYSLGNLIFDQHDAPTKKMIAVKLFVTGNHVDSLNVFPIVSRNSIPFPASRTEKFVPEIEGVIGSDYARTVWFGKK